MAINLKKADTDCIQHFSIFVGNRFYRLFIPIIE